MEALSAWLKQIILVVLLAAFIDLLLPNQKMQRYVKLVVSLFILMTILSPIMQLFGSNLNLRMLAATIDGWSVAGTSPDPSGGSPPPTGGKSIPALGEVLAEGKALERERNEQALTMLEEKLASMVAEHVRTQHRKNAEVYAELALDADGMPAIRDIRIRIRPGGEAAETPAAPEDAEGTKAVRPVDVKLEMDPIRVEPVRIGGDGESSADPSPPAEPVWQSDESPVNPAQRKAIASSVAQAWSVPVSIVHVE